MAPCQARVSSHPTQDCPRDEGETQSPGPGPSGATDHQGSTTWGTVSGTSGPWLQHAGLLAREAEARAGGH